MNHPPSSFAKRLLIVPALWVAASCSVVGSPSGPCTESLAESGCPATYEAIGDRDCPRCRAGTWSCPQTGTCGSLLVYSMSSYVGGSCYYDAATHGLVGSRTYSDITSFCDGTSFDVHSGVLPVGACSDLQPYCPADGQDGGDGGGGGE